MMFLLRHGVRRTALPREDARLLVHRKVDAEHRPVVVHRGIADARNRIVVRHVAGGVHGEFVTAYLAGLETDAEVLNLALPDDYIEHGSVDLLRSEVMLDIESCVARIITAYIAEESRRD